MSMWGSVSAAVLAGVAGAQHASHGPCPGVDPSAYVHPPRGWYSGDTHQHVQGCSGVLEEIRDLYCEMEATNLHVSNVLVWGTQGTFGDFACYVTGRENPISAGNPDRILQFGVEVSAVSADKLGHLIGLNVGPEEARIVRGDTASGDCYDDPLGLALGCPDPSEGDGSGDYLAPVAAHFRSRPEAVLGYAHQAWTTDWTLPPSSGGYPWHAKLVATGYTQDLFCTVDPSAEMSFPPLKTTVFPPTAPADVALGIVDFLETVNMEADYTRRAKLPAEWYGLYYKLLTAGLTTGLAAGTDANCGAVSMRSGDPRTYVYLDGPLSYDDWTRGIAEGRTTLATGHEQFLELSADGARPGSRLYVDSGDAVDVVATLHVADAGTVAPFEASPGTFVSDSLELVHDGVVVASSAPIDPGVLGGTYTFRADVPVLESGWIVARTASARTHTAAVYVHADDRPILDCKAAEYWMLWTDRMTELIDNTLSPAYPPNANQPYVGCSRDEIRAHFLASRRVFEGLRDHSTMLDPGLERYGASTPSALGPVAIDVRGPVHEGGVFSATCVNAPADSVGRLWVSRAPMNGTTVAGVRVWVDTGPAGALGSFQAVRSGAFAEAFVDLAQYPEVVAGSKLFVQYLWRRAPGAPGGTRSGSDAIEITVTPPGE